MKVTYVVELCVVVREFREWDSGAHKVEAVKEVIMRGVPLPNTATRRQAFKAADKLVNALCLVRCGS